MMPGLPTTLTLGLPSSHCLTFLLPKRTLQSRSPIEIALPNIAMSNIAMMSDIPFSLNSRVEYVG